MVKLKKSKPSLKTVYKSLNRKEPFSPTEKKEFSKKEQYLIRGIQLRDKKDKNEAVNFFRSYKVKGKKAVKSLASSIRKYNKSKYPKVGGKIEREVSEFKKPESKTQIRKKQKTQVSNYISSKKNKAVNPKRYQRISNAHKKYPNASLFELEHGVNSKASQEWRVRHGLNRNFK